jgi:hypothetical protein
MGWIIDLRTVLSSDIPKIISKAVLSALAVLAQLDAIHTGVSYIVSPVMDEFC